MFSPVDVIKVDFLGVDVIELDVLGARRNLGKPGGLDLSPRGLNRDSRS